MFGVPMNYEEMPNPFHKMPTATEKIIELQKFYQSTNKPIYAAHPRSKYYLIPYFGLLGVSVAATLFYTGRACFGIKDKK
ncbi:hypothetical protein LJB42_004687 [Komagataella kurtzmanii]|nr:hypothetical protein LJB42_004687 [Komagataella kurtzmanii]